MSSLSLQLPPDRALLVAFSGGLDSRVLLQLAWQHRQQHPDQPLRALHVHHGISPNADAWADFCQATCDALHIPLVIEKVSPQSFTQASLENRARLARYQAFEQQLQAGEILLQAHHRKDQAETLLLRLLRGSGVQGLSGMPASRPLGRGSLLRPLLHIAREQLEAFARTHQLRWVEDESNNCLEPARNFLRLKILPELARYFPAAEQNLALSARLLSDSLQLNRELAELDLPLCLNTQDSSLDISVLMQLGLSRRINLLRHWLQQRQLALPGTRHWTELDKLCQARADAQPSVCWSQQPVIEARRFRNRLYIEQAEHFYPLPDHYCIDWDGHSPLVLPGRTLHFRLLPPADQPRPQVFQVRARRGGETLHLAQRGGRDVKRLLQELDLPPWQRNQLPFIWLDDQLIAVGTCLVQSGWQVEASKN